MPRPSPNWPPRPLMGRGEQVGGLPDGDPGGGSRVSARFSPQRLPRHSPNAGTAANVGTMRITVELRSEAVVDSNWLPMQPGERAMLSGGGWSVPVSIRAISASSSDTDDQEARRILGPGHVLDDAEEWVAVMVGYGGQTRIASSFLPVADVGRVLRLGLEETGRMQRAEE